MSDLIRYVSILLVYGHEIQMMMMMMMMTQVYVMNGCFVKEQNLCPPTFSTLSHFIPHSTMAPLNTTIT